MIYGSRGCGQYGLPRRVLVPPARRLDRTANRTLIDKQRSVSLI